MEESRILQSIIESRRFDAVSKVAPTKGVQEALLNSNKFLPPCAHREESLRLLSEGKASCVVTGQQVGLYLGPLYTLYKASSAIRLAEQIALSSGKPCVPVFWLQTEDHDLEEIASASVLSRSSESSKLSLPFSSNRETASVAYETLGPKIDSLNEKLQSLLGFYPEAEHYLSLVKSFYRPEVSYADAFSSLLAEILKDSGLVFFNPRSQSVAEESKGVIHRSFSEYRQIAELLENQTQELRASGSSPQVYIRQDSPLAFFHLENQFGPRFRLQEQGHDWALIGDEQQRSVSSTDLSTALEQEPMRFSTSALLRPIVQDFLLPSVAYVGGAAEESYFAQLSPLYPHFGVLPAQFVRRNSYLIVEEKLKTWLTELGLTAKDLALPTAELHARIANSSHNNSEASYRSPEDLQSSSRSAVDALFDGIRIDLSALDPTLLNSSDKTKEKVLGLLERLMERYTSAHLRKQEKSLERLEKIQTALTPGGLAQERVFSPLSLLSRHGESFLELLRNEPLMPTETQERVL